MNSKKQKSPQIWLYLLIIAAATLGLYYSSLPYPLVYDSIGKLDATFLTPLIKDFSPFNLRWVTFINLWIDSLIFKQNYFWFRLENVVWHILNTGLLFFFLKQILQEFTPRQTLARSLSIPTMALMIAFLFAISPISLYAVINIIQRSIVLATFFSLLSLISYIHALKNQKIILVYLSVVFYFFAIYSKETAVLLFGVHIVLTYLLRSSLKNPKSLILPFILTVICASQMILDRSDIIGQVYEPKTALILPHQALTKNPWFLSLQHQGALFFKYIYLWLFPLPQSLTIDIVTEPPKDYFSLQTLSFILCLLSPLFCIWIFLKQKSHTLFALGLSYIFILFLTEFSTVRLHETFVLYRSYLWAPGIFLILIDLMFTLKKSQQIVFFILLAALFTFSSVTKIKTFESSLVLWQDAAENIDLTHPDRLSLNAYRPFASIGGYLTLQNKHNEATSYYKKALELRPDLYNIYNSLGVSLSLSGHRDEAMPHFEKAISLQPDSHLAYYNLASMYFENRDYDKAKDYLEKTLQYMPGHDAAHYHLGKIYYIKQDYVKAVEHYEKSLQLNPKQPKAMEQLAQVLANQRRFNESVQLLVNALMMDPKSKSIMETLKRLELELNKAHEKPQ